MAEPGLNYEKLRLPVTWGTIEVHCDFIEGICIAHPLRGGFSQVTLTLGGMDIPVLVSPGRARDIIDLIAQHKAGRDA